MSPSQQQYAVFKGIYEFEDPGGTLIAARIPYSGTADLYSGTTILVRPNQCVLFVYKGEVTDVLMEGTHKVETKNFPIITRLANWQFGFRIPLRCEILFFSNTIDTARRWGTAQPVIYDFPDYQGVPIRAFGLFNVVPRDPKLIYRTLIGNRTSYDITELERFVQGQITELLPEALSVVESLQSLNKHQDNVSKKLQTKVNKILKGFGLEVIELQVMSLVPSQEVLKALDTKAAMNIVGDKQEFLLYKAANSLLESPQSEGLVGGGNSASNDPMQLMLGLMLGKNLISSNFREKEQAVFPRMIKSKEKQTRDRSYCSSCGHVVAQNDKFCSSCGKKL